jgi:hypothetical protein
MFRLYPDFLVLLEEIRNHWPWWLDRDAAIRTQTPSGLLLDPITAAAATVTNVAWSLGGVDDAARAIGLAREITPILVDAIERIGAYNACVRADILNALDLSELWGQEGRWNDPSFHQHPWPHQYDRPLRAGGGTWSIASRAGRSRL